MRNLLTIERSVAGTTSTEVPDLPLSAIAWGGSEESLICTHGPSGVEAAVELKRVNVGFESLSRSIFLLRCKEVFADYVQK